MPRGHVPLAPGSAEEEALSSSPALREVPCVVWGEQTFFKCLGQFTVKPFGLSVFFVGSLMYMGSVSTIDAELSRLSASCSSFGKLYLQNTRSYHF